MSTYFKKPVLITALCVAFGGLMAVSTAYATDHGDTALVNGANRTDARLTDYFALNRGKMLALIIDTNPTLGTPGQITAQHPDQPKPQTQTEYIFPTDVKFSASIDNHSAVDFNDPVRNAQHGGTVRTPADIKENFTFTFTFDSANKPTVTMSSLDTELGISGFYPTEVNQGELVYVLGSGFNSEETKVKVNGRRAPFSKVLSDNVLVFIAPFGGKTGAISISTETEDEATDTETKAKVTSASELKINKFKGFNPDAIQNLKDIVSNTAALDLIKAGNVAGLAQIGLPVKTFSGLRDDPFIRLPQQGKNVAAMAVELPQSLFTHGRQKVLLSWSTTSHATVAGPVADVAGRSFATMFSPEQLAGLDATGVSIKNPDGTNKYPSLNAIHPSLHVSTLEAKEADAPVAGTLNRNSFLLPCQTPFQPFSAVQSQTLATLVIDCAPGQRMLKTPDVIIFDTTKAQAFPNGRDLDNDQIDYIGSIFDPRVENLRRGEMNVPANPLDNHGVPFVLSPSANDVPHDANFPYLGLPQI